MARIFLTFCVLSQPPPLSHHSFLFSFCSELFSFFYLNCSPFLNILSFSPSVQTISLAEELSWIFYFSHFYLNFSSFLLILSFSPSVQIISLAEELSWIFYLSLLYLNFSPFLNILSFSPSAQNYFPFRDLASNILLFLCLSQPFSLSEHFFFSPSV